MYWLQTTMWRCALGWCSQELRILAGGARCRILKGFLKIYRGLVVQQNEDVVLWRSGAVCSVVKNKPCIVELCIELCCEDEVVHFETVHCVTLWSSGALWNCALCYVVMMKWCILKQCIVLLCEVVVHCGTVHCVVLWRESFASWNYVWYGVSKEGDMALEVKCVYGGGGGGGKGFGMWMVYLVCNL